MINTCWLYILSCNNPQKITLKKKWENGNVKDEEKSPMI